MIPKAWQVRSELKDFCSLALGYGRLLLFSCDAELLLKARHLRQSFIPPLLKVPDHETILGLDGIKLSVCTIRLIACLHQCELSVSQLLRSSMFALCNRL